MMTNYAKGTRDNRPGLPYSTRMPPPPRPGGWPVHDQQKVDWLVATLNMGSQDTAKKVSNQKPSKSDSSLKL